MVYSHEILANIKKIHIFWVISGAFESPIVKRGQLQIARSNQVKELFNIGMYFFYTKGMIPTIVKAWINSVDFKVFSKVEKEKNILNRSTWEIRRSMEKISCFLTLNHTHLSQPYIKSIDFFRDEGENKQNMLIFVSGCSTPLKCRIFIGCVKKYAWILI